MKAIYYSFRVFIQQILRDDMLWAVCCAPLLAGLFFRFAIPAIDQWLAGILAGELILESYYLLFDLLLNLLTPYMFCFAAAMVMLTEYDENIAVYMAVTPVGKKGYIISRLMIPAVISIPAAILFTVVFSLTRWTFVMLVAISVLSSLLSVAVTMLLVSLSNNRVEGMALAKLSGLMMLGLPIPFFIFSNYRFLFSPLPSYWLSLTAVSQNYVYMIPAVLTACCWSIFFYRKFKSKLSG